MAKTARKTGKGTKRRRASPQGIMWPWYVAGLLIVGGVGAYDNLPSVRGWFRAQNHLVASSEPVSKPVRQRESEAHTAAIPQPGLRPVEKAVLKRDEQALPRLAPPQDIPAVETVALRTGPAGPFYFCTDQKTNCVIDGGSFWFNGRKVGLADVSMPRMKMAKCDAERELGSRAKRRLREILNAGEFKLLAANGKSGGQMHVVLSDGTLISDRLIAEGLAHSLKDAGKPWC
ncbi:MULTISPECIES: hypothetical protein [unclassified Rhizobium]|uniref:hypothetical protein n=1 Tax=unclassified Rhizobium TaxID=2613769 RepID=UPI0012E3D3D6|nr:MULTISPECIES: hypothetical protein [unclassified Rhizobium]